jgi:hypothetical protein
MPLDLYFLLKNRKNTEGPSFEFFKPLFSVGYLISNS